MASDLVNEDPYSKVNGNYTDHQVWVLRVLGVSSSVSSLVFGLVAFYLYICMNRRNFRHHLIVLLLMADFLKALVLLWFPARLITTQSAQQNKNFCAIVGFFTATSIELSDLAVLSLAVHFALLVFKSEGHSGTNNFPQHPPQQGGLYPYRKFVYFFNVISPLTMAALAFVKRGVYSYLPYQTWCYLPIRPVWYRIVLSWGWRYAIIIAIIVVYVSIYVHVKMEYRQVVHHLGQSQTFVNEEEFNTFKRRLIRLQRTLTAILAYFPGFSFIQRELTLHQHHGHHHLRRIRGPHSGEHDSNQEETDQSSRIEDAALRERQTSQAEAIAQFQRDTLERFQERKSIIERQIRSIFIYPAAYVFLWIFPFIEQCIMYDSEPEGSSVYWISCIATFMMPLNCWVDTISFCVRERPWRDRKERVFTTKYIKMFWNRYLGRDKDRRQQRLNSGDTAATTIPEEWKSSASEAAESQTQHSPQVIQGKSAAVQRSQSQSNQPNLDPFGWTTARRVDVEKQQEEEEDDEDDGEEMDLMEFLK